MIYLCMHVYLVCYMTNLQQNVCMFVLFAVLTVCACEPPRWPIRIACVFNAIHVELFSSKHPIAYQPTVQYLLL